MRLYERLPLITSTSFPPQSQKPEHFPLPASLTAKLTGAKRDLLRGRGFSLISGGLDLHLCVDWIHVQHWLPCLIFSRHRACAIHAPPPGANACSRTLLLALCSLRLLLPGAAIHGLRAALSPCVVPFSLHLSLPMPCHSGAGLPVGEWSERQCVAAYLGLSVHLGRPQPQSKDGERVFRFIIACIDALWGTQRNLACQQVRVVCGIRLPPAASCIQGGASWGHLGPVQLLTCKGCFLISSYQGHSQTPLPSLLPIACRQAGEPRAHALRPSVHQNG